MSEEQKPQVPMRISDRQLKSSYANAFRTQSTPDEVIIDFGLNRAEVFPPQTPGAQPVQGMALDLNSRVIMNWRNAKRLAADLNRAVGAFEQQFGEIPSNNG